jgi:hypothetical protein
MAEKEVKKTVKKEVKKEVKKAVKYKVTKSNGNVIYRDDLGEYVKKYESKGWKVEEVA